MRSKARCTLLRNCRGKWKSSKLREICQLSRGNSNKEPNNLRASNLYQRLMTNDLFHPMSSPIDEKALLGEVIYKVSIILAIALFIRYKKKLQYSSSQPHSLQWTISLNPKGAEEGLQRAQVMRSPKIESSNARNAGSPT
ncbi:hypothetical protein FGO68_gene10472 [Halteria grandinella]|uniref:Uncharacterized protein n=1 Tax=Halteria grandinella TaxID=5974 RepID=A0A8J8NQN6_HALGN|nr:hypothetical protein FGO68_gene10472 [Halteria grandinella]